jgi:hypothetical protein
VTAPFLPPSQDGYHPVSGNRQFGFILHPNGNMELYTKGADRYFTPPPTPGQASPNMLFGYLIEKLAFSGADNLWESFQQGISSFVNDPNFGGSGVINTPIKKRPKVKDELKNLLNQQEPINYIPCGN